MVVPSVSARNDGVFTGLGLAAAPRSAMREVPLDAMRAITGAFTGLPLSSLTLPTRRLSGDDPLLAAVAGAADGEDASDFMEAILAERARPCCCVFRRRV